MWNKVKHHALRMNANCVIQLLWKLHIACRKRLRQHIRTFVIEFLIFIRSFFFIIFSQRSKDQKKKKTSINLKQYIVPSRDKLFIRFNNRSTELVLLWLLFLLRFLLVVISAILIVCTSINRYGIKFVVIDWFT